ncbi:MAG: hypothetical protein EBZ58_05675 [Bacteroidetes bacterium]|nr:hypothetical protein [Bacteroidota bacterium]
MIQELLLVKDAVINTIKDTNYWLKHEDSLKNRLIVECRVNLALIDMALWNDVSNNFKHYLIVQLQTEALELASEFSSENVFKFIEKKIFIDEKSQTKGRTFSIIISKIKALKVIANIPEDLSADNKSRISARINHLKGQILELLKDLEAIK